MWIFAISLLASNLTGLMPFFKSHVKKTNMNWKEPQVHVFQQKRVAFKTRHKPFILMRNKRRIGNDERINGIEMLLKGHSLMTQSLKFFFQIHRNLAFQFHSIFLEKAKGERIILMLPMRSFWSCLFIARKTQETKASIAPEHNKCEKIENSIGIYWFFRFYSQPFLQSKFDILTAQFWKYFHFCIQNRNWNIKWHHLNEINRNIIVLLFILFERTKPFGIKYPN